MKTIIITMLLLAITTVAYSQEQCVCKTQESKTIYVHAGSTGKIIGWILMPLLFVAGFYIIPLAGWIEGRSGRKSGPGGEMASGPW